jgi:hypothetical protein
MAHDGHDGGSGPSMNRPARPTDAGSPATSGTGGTTSGGGRNSTPNSVLTASGGRARVSRQVYSVQLARWKWANAYCTDRVALEIVIVGYPPETPARIRIIHVNDSNAETEIETIDATLSGGRIEAQWNARGASATTLSGRIVFRASLSILPSPIDSSNALNLQRISDLPKTPYASGRSHFDLTLDSNTARIESDIRFVKGWGGAIVRLQGFVPNSTGGVIAGFQLRGQCRWMKQVGTTRKYWDGSAWQNLPSGFTLQDGNNVCVGFYRSGDNYVCQYGGQWPEAFADYNIDSETNRNKVDAWKNNVNTTWTGKHYIKRTGCSSAVVECCRYSVQARVRMLKQDSFTAGMLIVANGNIRSNDSLWFLGETRIAMAAHEFGHHLGNGDEYAGATSVDTSLNGDGAVNGIDADSIMGSNLTKVKKRHYRTLCLHLQSMVRTATTRTFTYSAIDL